MINDPNIPGPPHTQQGKLVLPAQPENQYRRTSSNLPPTQVPIRPEQLIRREGIPPPKGAFVKLRYLWHKDPAYKVLMIAIGMVVLSSLIFVSLISNAMLHNPDLVAQSSNYSQNPPTTVVPTGTVDLHPTFPTPNGGQGTGASSQPPLHSTPILQPTTATTPTVQPSPTQDGALSIQITNIPNRVQNNSTVNVDVNTSQPNVDVSLYIFYNAAPNRGMAGPSTTDDNGNTTIQWSVTVFKAGVARATVIAVARDANGQRVQSQPVTVTIIGFGQ